MINIYMKKLLEVLRKLFGSSSSSSESSEKGFTLIELLIVIAVLGVLVTAILVALNPAEQIRRANDSGRLNSVSQLGNAIQAYYTAQGGSFPTANATWQTTLVSAGELSAVVTVTAPAANCTTNVQGGVCYQQNGTDSTAWTVLESSSEKTRAGCTGTQVAVAAWSFSRGKSGIVCVATATTSPGYNPTLQ